jgi:uncharacterized protein (DUF1501 family)
MANSLSRRHFLQAGTASLAMWGLMPRHASASARDPRLLTVILRGALDGLSLAAPVGDPAYAALRGAIALAKPGDDPGAGLPLDSLFVLNPGMPFLHSLYAKHQALIVHATASPYRARSHFDGQDVLQSGLPGVGRVADGWLNRALAGMASEGAVSREGLGIGAIVPLVIRGQAPVMSWIPKTLRIPLRESTIARLTDLYASTDPALAKAFSDGVAIGRMGDTGDAGATKLAPNDPKRRFRPFIEAAAAAARLMSPQNGPRIGALYYDGWDTHANEGAAGGQLATRLSGLDLAIETFVDGMGPAWADTAVVVITEFGRTVHVNGTAGTDHGTATTALLIGGKVKGGRVIADWPGLEPKALYEGRDLAPTTDLRSVLKGILADHVGVPRRVLDDVVFPASAPARPMTGLFA